jgi:hypothetical protein
VNNVAVDGLGMRHLSDGFRSNSLHREGKIALALTIPPERGGKEENMMGRRKRINETKAKNCLGHRDGREKDVGGGMTNENDKPRIWVGIGEPTHNATTSDDTTRGGCEWEREGEELTLTSVDHSPACRLSQQ